MDEFKRLKKFSVNFINRKKHKKIDKLKDKEERLIVLQNSLISELRLKHLDFELKLKKIKDKKKKHMISLKSNLIHSKITLLRADFNEKDFKKINSLLDKLGEEIENA
ncbi:MAG: hypothetical protein NTZ83_00445 [Candidatus Pacearchaeota archaeon]|nr:hypothetical protein [Candidatus Pacearchaeota archaeon]